MMERSASTAMARSDVRFEGVDSGRQAERLRTSTIQILLDGETYEIADISVSGFLILAAPDWIVAGQYIDFRFVVTVADEVTYVPASGKVIRAESHDLAVEYEAPHPNWQKILPHHIRQHG